MDVNDLAFKFNLDSIYKLEKLSANILPNQSKYPLTYKALKSAVSQYFDSCPHFSNAFFPVFESSFVEQKKLKKFVLDTISFNFFSSIILFVFKIILLIIFKSNLLKIRYPNCEIAPNKYRSSDLYFEINLLALKIKYKIRPQNRIHAFFRGLVTSSLSPLSVLLFYFLSILPRININHIQYLKKTNPLFLRLIETSLEYDLKITKSFLSSLEIKSFTHSGWFSVKGSILFKALKALNINTKVYAHGHLSQPSLAFYYPVESSTFVVFTEEEALRLKKLSSFFNQPLKNIEYILPDLIIDKEKIRNSLKNSSTILLGFSSPDFLANELIVKKYNYLVKSLLKLKLKVFCRPHHQASEKERIILSINGQIPIYKDDIKLLDREKTLIIGSSSTLLIDAAIAGIMSFEISDFSVNCSWLIKSLPCYTIEKFLTKLEK